ncbi:MAG: imidazole glycerol phosphate synthase subunit HisH, partial [Chitinophagaceae bacterium]
CGSIRSWDGTVTSKWSDRHAKYSGIGKKIPILGICLGMQLMCNRSDEGSLPGLGWIDAEVLRFSPDQLTNLRVPHMGWNTVDVQKENFLLPLSDAERRFYFVHSYKVACRDADDIVSITHYGEDFVSAFQRNNLFGVQFHPEKSHRFGMSLFRNFVEANCAKA